MRITLMELMIIVAALGFACSRIAVSNRADTLATALLAALSLGPAVTGPPLLLWRKRQGTLVGKWGIGEVAWFLLGLYFLALMVLSLLLPSRAEGDRWLTLALVTGAAGSVAVLIFSGLRWLLPLSRAVNANERNWFIGRWTNRAGLAILALTAAGAVVAFFWWR